jgi:hypothetical protein
MAKSSAPSQITLERFDWQGDETDKDSNFKQELATYSRVDPMPTIETMSRNLGIPVGAIVRYILARWASSGSASLLEVGPRVVRQMADIVAEAESAGEPEAKLQAYEKMAQIISWLNVPLADPNWRPGRGSKG